LRGVSKDGRRVLVADPSRRGQEAAPQDEGSVGLAKTAGRCVHAVAPFAGTTWDGWWRYLLQSFKSLSAIENTASALISISRTRHCLESR
jgi:hypothetical protein